MSAEVTQRGVIDMQVCIPEGWNDDQVIAFAEAENVCGTLHGWQIRRAGSRLLEGASERVACTERPNHCHIMLDA